MKAAAYLSKSKGQKRICASFKDYCAKTRRRYRILPQSKVKKSPQNLVRIGNDYIKLQKTAEALAYFEKALENSHRLERKSIQAYVLSECGNAQATVGNKNEALNFYRQSLDLWRNLKQDKVVANLEEKIAKLEAN